MAEAPNQDEQLRQLRECVSQIRDLLQAAVSHPQDIVPGRHHAAMQEAWKEVLPSFSVVISLVDAKHVDGLKSVGLDGNKLVFELGVFNHARGELLDHAPEVFSNPNVALKQQKDATWWGRLRRLFRRCLKAADVVLGSMAEIPGFEPAELIKQFKEGVEEAVAIRQAVADDPK
jgi:hypothetical protein